MALDKGTAAGRWEAMSLSRSQYLERAIQCSALTIPALIPESDNSSGYAINNTLNSLYQGAGARGVNGVSARTMLVLYPAGQPFFRLGIDKAEVDAYIAKSGEQADDAYSTIDSKMARIEQALLQRMDKKKCRIAVFEALRHLFVGGNALLYVGKGPVKMYPLRSYCVERDPEENVCEMVIREVISRRFLPAGMQKKVADTGMQESDEQSRFLQGVPIYTHVKVTDDGKKVEWYQEVEGEVVPKSGGFAPIELNPWLPLRLYRIAGEDYGRSLVEDVIGDLQSLESLGKAIVEGSLISAKTIFLCNPNGMTRADILNNAENGAIVPGNINDVAALETGKSRDYATALQTMQLIERRLSYVFLNNEAVQRDAERVTAEEIRLIAEQLEQGMGGLYSMLSDELQLPLVRLIYEEAMSDGAIPPIPEGLVSPQITTGVDAIGRGNERNRLMGFAQAAGSVLGPEQLNALMNPSEFLSRLASSDAIDTKGLIKTKKQLDAEQAKAQQLQLASQLTQQGINDGATQSPLQSAGAPAAASAGPTGPAPAPAV